MGQNHLLTPVDEANFDWRRVEPPVGQRPWWHTVYIDHTFAGGMQFRVCVHAQKG